ncbi:hypothetical protein SAMN04488550_4116 [Gordonia malaquae]|uniref:Uncharacterized protein n=1 Tax=Gordonia malaquae NBRC 108250 TaxID=1223542 RepID=M3VC14_GORML|nr:hypothetical protein [Gordonia malaquae]GAC81218.1 hypothetical protein GM1_030_00470 [Gordonia malaquae NBRC 108250]SEE23562.1 hypothetical protein SAMN04488550_4116 [Gordonia malaquae]
MVMSTAGFQGPVSESQEAGRFLRIAPPALVDGPNDLRVTTAAGTRTVSVAAGTAQVCGVTVKSDAATSLTFAANSGGTRLDVVVLRVVWAGPSSAVSIVVKQGTSGSSTLPTLTRSAGATYEMPLAVVSVGTSVTTITSPNIFNVATYGGLGGRMRIAQESYCAIADGATGAEMAIEGTTRTYRRNSDGSWTLVTDVNSPWKYFDPIIRYKGDGNVQAGTASLGTGGVRRGRFKVVDQFLIGEIEVRTGSAGWNFGAGDLTIDMPPGYGPDTNFADRWLEGHLYTTDESLMDWPIQALVKGGETTALMYSPTSGADCRMKPMRATDSTNGTGKGIPLIGSARSNPKVIVISLLYSVV